MSTDSISQTATNVTANVIVDDAKANTPQEDRIDPAIAREKLERKLNHRPEKQELVDRNILKDSKVAPALQAAQAHLQRSQLEDKLDQALQHRPPAEELVKSGILQGNDIPLSK